MFLQCFIFYIIYCLSIILPILFQIQNIFILIISQSIYFSLIIYPIFCGLIKNNMLFFFNLKYFNCVKTGFLLFYMITFMGSLIFIPFIKIHSETNPSNLQLITAILGGLCCTIWLISLTNWVFIPFWPDLNLTQSLKLSKRLVKKHKLIIFTLLFQTYIQVSLIILAPRAIKHYIRKINKLKNQFTLEIESKIIYIPKNKQVSNSK